MCNFIKEKTLTQVFSCKFREISKDTVFTEHLSDCFSKGQKVSKKSELQGMEYYNFLNVDYFLLKLEYFMYDSNLKNLGKN